MSKRKASTLIERTPKQQNTSKDCIFYNGYAKNKIQKISPTKIGKRPIYQLFIDHDNQYFLTRCMLDRGSTSFVLSPQAAKAFQIPVIKRTKKVKCKDIGGKKIEVEGRFIVPLGLSFGNHRSYDEENHAFEVMQTSQDYDALLPAWYLEEHKAAGTTTSHLHFPHCQQKCFTHGKFHPEYSITYDKRVALDEKAIHIGAIVLSNPSLINKLPLCYHKFMLLFDPEEAEKLPDNKDCDQRIELLVPDDKLRMGRIYQLSIEEEKILVKYLDTMIRKIRFVPQQVRSEARYYLYPNLVGRDYGYSLISDILTTLRKKTKHRYQL